MPNIGCHWARSLGELGYHPGRSLRAARENTAGDSSVSAQDAGARLEDWRQDQLEDRSTPAYGAHLMPQSTGNEPPPPCIGLTGGIACGKSAVAQILSALGFPVVDADVIAREVVAPGSPALDAIIQTFGHQILDPHGHLDRSALGEIVFHNADLRRTLEGIVHPAIAQASAVAILEACNLGADLVFYEAALLVETGRYRDFPSLIVVNAPEALQRQRLMNRDGLSESEAQARMDSQWPLEKKLALADHVIINDDSLETLRARTLAVVDKLR